MFKKILLIVILFSSINSKAADVLDVICDSLCNSIAEDNYTAPENMSVELYFGLKIIKYCQMYPNELKSQYNLNIDKMNSPNMKKFGTKIGERIVLKCPDTFAKLFSNEGESFDDYTIEEQITSSTATIKGKIFAVEEGEFICIIVEDNSLKKTKLFYLEHFPGASQLMDNYDNLVGESVIVDYEDKEFFNAKLKEYIYYKVIKQITFME